MEGDLSASDTPFDLEFLQKEAIGFSVNGDQVKVLFTTEQFYNALIEECRSAKHRVYLAALYIGMSSMEQNLVDVLDDRLTELGSNLELTIMLDAIRESRDLSARKMLSPLIKKHSHCRVSLYQTPDLNMILSQILPTKANELVGVQHMKLYVFDNNLMITGANVTKDYFTNRQDRYLLVTECQLVADFCCGLVDKICSISLQLTADNRIVKPLTFPPPGEYKKLAHQIIWDYYQEVYNKSDKHLKVGDDTWIFPLVQLPPMTILQDSSVTSTILKSLDPEVTVYFSSPYFNFPTDYIDLLLKKCKNTFKILIPHPSAIDFFGAGGFAGQIPWMYSVFSSIFLRQVEDTNQLERLSIEEYVNSGKSFHSKGFWCTAPGDNEPFMTIVGSSNFNCRSVQRDLECQFVVVTNNRGLRQRLAEEKQRLYAHGTPITQEVLSRPDRKLRPWHYIFFWIFKSFL